MSEVNDGKEKGKILEGEISSLKEQLRSLKQKSE
jgi:hypothetical protein